MRLGSMGAGTVQAAALLTLLRMDLQLSAAPAVQEASNSASALLYLKHLVR